MQLLTTTGFTTGCYGEWLNTIMESSPSEWVMIHDHDIFLIDPDWYNIILGHIHDNPDAGLFVAVTNRIGNPQQKVKTDMHNHDLTYHAHIARQVKGKPLIEATRPISGVVMVTSKTAWKIAGGFRPCGTIGTDTNYYGKLKEVGYKTYIMQDLYVYHKYRADLCKPKD